VYSGRTQVVRLIAFVVGKSDSENVLEGIELPELFDDLFRPDMIYETVHPGIDR
jgi:hypothetical protein